MAAAPNKFTVKFPSGAEFDFDKLDEQAVVFIKNQFKNRELKSLESLAEDRRQYRYKQPKRTGWAGFFSKFGPFADDKNQVPKPGRYQLILAEDKAEFFEFGICGSALEILKSNRTYGEIFGTGAQQIVATEYLRSLMNYRFAVVFNYLVISLDFSQYHKYLLSVLPPIDINGGGTISGQIHNLASALPYESLARIIASGIKVDSILITGKGWSGSIAHACAIMLREFLWQWNIAVPVKAVSFDGPLCGSESLVSNIAKSNHINNHITICNGDDILDRLICDYQKLSPLMADAYAGDKKGFIYSVINSAMKQYHSEPGHAVLIDLTVLSQAETNLSNNVTITKENDLHPVGRFLIRDGNGAFKDPSDQSDQLSQISRLQRQLFRPSSNLTDTLPLLLYGDVMTHSPQDFVAPNLGPLKPKLFSFNMIKTNKRVTMNFIGEYLDSLTCRLTLTDKELEINADQLDSMPFKFRGKFIPSAHAKIISLAPSYGKVVIEVFACEFGHEGEVSLFTDFGETNSVKFNNSNVVNGEEPAPSKSLHPTMNAEFLSAAVLRIALCCRMHKPTKGPQQGSPGSFSCRVITKTFIAESLEKYPRLNRLWKLILSLEKNLKPNEEPLLEKYLNQYLSDEVDIPTMRNMCISVLADISRKTVEDYVPRENFLLKATRKVLGMFGLAGGEILMGISFLLLFIPYNVLFLPLASYHAMPSHSPQSLGVVGQFGLAAHYSLVGILALPGLIVNGIGYFLKSAASYALKDRESLLYKRILKDLLLALGGSPLDVVDELCSLEDRVVKLFESSYPGKDLHERNTAEILMGIDETIGRETRKFVEKSSEEEGGDDANKESGLLAAKHLKDSFEKQPILLKKLILVGHIHTMRTVLENNIMIGFIGVHNAGKSTIINRLFDVDTNADLVVRTEEPMQYILGNWIERFASSHSCFKDWLADGEKSKLQISAVDFPGTSDERMAVGLITRFTAEVASMFIIILKAGHVAGPEKDVVKVAIDNHKPFLVVINHCDAIQHELHTASSFERVKESYAKVLGIPDHLIFFISAFNPRQIDSLRGVIYLMVQNLLGNTVLSNSLPLHFINDQTMEILHSSKNGDHPSVLDDPKRLCDATSSLLFNLSSVSAKLIMERLHLLNKQILLPSEATANHPLAIESGVIDELRSLACQFDIDNDIYEIVSEAFNICVKNITDFAKMHSEELATSHPSAAIIENYLASKALSILNKKIKVYFNSCVKESRAEVGIDEFSQFLRVGTDVLLGFNSIFTFWKDERGYKANEVKLALRNLLSSEEPFTDGNMWTYVCQARASCHYGSKEEGFSGESSDHLSSEWDTALKVKDSVADSTAHQMTEFERYQGSKRRLENLIARMFPTSDIKHIYQGWGTIKEFYEGLKIYAAKKVTNYKVIEVNNNHLVDSVIEGLMNLPESELETADIHFKIRGDPAVDVNGVTRSVLTKVAEQINANPSSVLLLRDSESKLIYFDPRHCYSSSAGEKQAAQTRYLGIGRLIGLCLRKSILGATLPINFPITIYKWLLGYSIGLADLRVINPQVAATIYKICLMEEEVLNASQLSFSVPLGENMDFNLGNNGEKRRVTAECSMDFLLGYVQLKLCCFPTDSKNDAVRNLALGVQHLCPRELFNKLSPVSLQLVLEGEQNLDVPMWQKFTEVKNGWNENSVTVDLFWKVLGLMSQEEKQRLLCFVVGTSTLPAKGFEDLYPSFTLIVGTISMSTEALPVSHTCFHMLIIPRYTSQEVMREKLIMACTETDTMHFGKA